MIEYDHVSKRYGNEGTGAAAVRELSMRVDEGEFCVLLGPSGCGKTTLLRMTNRLVEPSGGTIRIQGRSVTEEDPVKLRRSIGYAIQGVGLFPHRTVEQNVATTLKLAGIGGTESRRRVAELLEMVRLDPAEYASRYPGQLSGGEAQRVGVARALANDPPLLLMDEPFGAIDPINRSEIQRQFRDLQRELNKTVVLVTHDVSEAFMFGDRIALMRDGRLVQFDSPSELMRNPTDDFVRDFFGAEAELLLLDSYTPRDVMTPMNERSSTETGRNDSPPGSYSVAPDTSLRTALGTMLAVGRTSLPVREGNTTLGLLTFDAILETMKRSNRGEKHG